METITVDKRDYDRLTGKLATLEAELKHARNPLEATAKVGWWRRLGCLGPKAAVAVVLIFSLSTGAWAVGTGMGFFSANVTNGFRRVKTWIYNGRGRRFSIRGSCQAKLSFI